MHSYVKDGNRWDVIFDNGGIGPVVLRTFKDERYAAAYVHYLNGGDLQITLEFLYSVSKEDK